MEESAITEEQHGFPRRDARPTVIPLENNPAVLNPLAHTLGLHPSLAFYDIYSLDDPDLLSVVPRSVHAILLLMPMNEPWRSMRAVEDSKMPAYKEYGASEPVFWIKQTINNACGSIAMLHCIVNTTPDAIVPRTFFENFLAKATQLPPVPRADLLATSDEFLKAHGEAAAKGDTDPPPIEAAHTPNYYVAFVRGKDGHLWELEGGRSGPIDRGVLKDGEDLLEGDALNAGVKGLLERILNQSKEGNVTGLEGPGEFNFSCTVLAGKIE